MKKVVGTFLLAFLAWHTSPAQSNQKMDRFIDQLMAKMTVEEKIGQLNSVVKRQPVRLYPPMSTQKLEMVKSVVFSA